MGIKMFAVIVDLFETMNYKCLTINYKEPFEKVASIIRGMVLETIDAVFLMVPEILKQDKEVQTLLFRVIFVKLEHFFKGCLQIITEKCSLPMGYPMDNPYSSLHNFLVVLIEKSVELKEHSNGEALLHMGSCVCDGAMLETCLS